MTYGLVIVDIVNKEIVKTISDDKPLMDIEQIDNQNYALMFYQPWHSQLEDLNTWIKVYFTKLKYNLVPKDINYLVDLTNINQEDYV